MSFTRLQYDKYAYRHDLSQSVGPSQYILSTPWTATCAPCLSTDGAHGPSGQGVATCVSKPVVDVDSELLGITRKASKDPGEAYCPSGAPFCETTTQVIDCPAAGRSEDTRLSNPPCTLRSTGFNRWEWLCQNPQERVEIPFDFNINSQLIVKDSHRAVIPKPFDPSLALPPDHDTPVVDVPPCPPPVRQNLPLVSWRSCDEISRY